MVLEDAEGCFHAEDGAFELFGAAADDAGGVADFEFADVLPGCLGESAEILHEALESSSGCEVACPH